MEIRTPEQPPHTVVDWEVLPVGIPPYTITVDEAAGDTCIMGPVFTTFRLTEKPSPVDPEVKLRAIQIDLVMQNIISLTRSVRVVQELTPEQKHEWRRKLEQLSGGVKPTYTP